MKIAKKLLAIAGPACPPWPLASEGGFGAGQGS